MDRKDSRLLASLVADSSAPTNRLAKSAAVSREVASYRIRRLMNRGIIRGFYTIIDAQKLGFSRYTCFLKLKGISLVKEEAICASLVRHSFITFLGQVVGRWNLVFDMLARDRAHLESLVNEIRGTAHPYLDRCVVLEAGASHEAYPAKLFGVSKRRVFGTASRQAIPDAIDYKILKTLSTDARLEYAQLSKLVGLSANAIRYRIRNLEASGIIQGYTISIDMRKLGYEWYNVQVKLSEHDPRLTGFLRQHKRVIYFYQYVGHENWDLDIGIAVKGSVELREVMLELRELFGGVLSIHDVYVTTEELKGDYAPEGIFREEQPASLHRHIY